MQLHSDDFRDGQPIPATFAFGRPGDAGEPCVLAANRNPHLAWTDAPAGTRSFVLTCIDLDAPTSGEDVNQPAQLPHFPSDSFDQKPAPVMGFRAFSGSFP